MKVFKLALLFTCLLFTNKMYSQPDTQPIQISMPGPHIGVAFGFTYGYDSKPQIFIPQLNQMNVHLTKLYLFWQQLEPEKGKFQWNAVDSFLKQLQPNDEALISLFSSSTWATKVPSTVLPPSPAKVADDYYHFVYALVKHCKGKIKLWQNDSEPNNPIYWNGTNEEFISELKIFYKAVKDADPDAKVVAGGYDGLFNPPGMPEIPGQKVGLTFFENVIKEATDYFDIFDIRLYANPYTIPARVQYFKKLLAETGKDKPIICTEYNGPGFFGFPVNFKYIGQVMKWTAAVAKGDTAAFLELKNPLVELYDSINTLALQTQMFMIGCSKSLDDKYHRLECRDIVVRNILAFSAGIQKTMFWDLTHSTDDKYSIMTLMFGKNKLIDYENNKVVKEYPEAKTFKLMTSFLSGLKSVTRIPMPGIDDLYFYQITRKETHKPLYVVWEKRDVFSGEDHPADNYSLPCGMKHAKATDIFGNNIPVKISNDSLQIDVSDTPVFIEGENNNK
jgi:hypothetical protein